MNFTTSLTVKSFGIVLGSLAGVTLFSSVSTAATPTSGTNPCPGIYYQEPYNRLLVVPRGCPPNAMVPQLESEQRSLPEGQQPVLATIMPQMGKVGVMLKNATDAPITYQVLGNTQQRTLAGRGEIMLQALPVPTTLTFLRPDGGLVRVVPIANSQPGVLDVTLNGAMGLSDSQTTLRIQDSGKVNAY
jgi:hypothetical protein